MRWSNWWFGVTLASLAVVPPAAAAQNALCTPYSGTSGNLCNAAVDGVRAFQPTAGMIVSGGNPEVGRVGTLGGFGHVALTLRATGAAVTLPDPGYDGSSTTVAAGQELLVPEVTLDAAVGVFRGLDSGLLAVDFLAALQLLPTDQIDDLTLDPDAHRVGGIGVSLAYGARVGLFGGPDDGAAGTVSIMRRTIPRYTYGDGAYAFSTDLRATNLRANLGYRASMVSVGVGGGVDWYASDAVGVFFDPTVFVFPQSVDLAPRATRYLLFVNAALQLPVLSIAGEVGYQLGEDLGLSTSFEGHDPASGLVFFSLGLTVGLR